MAVRLLSGCCAGTGPANVRPNRGGMTVSLFGNKAKHESKAAKLQDEVDRLASLTDRQLAAEVMNHCSEFGPDFESIAVGQLASTFVPGYGMQRGQAVDDLLRLIGEGTQSLENAGLLIDSGYGGAGDGEVYSVSRAGQAALAQGTIEQALEGGSS